MFCRGSKKDTRGFSCGLWVLLHSLSVRVEDGESQMAFTATCDFIHQFFICDECRQHFYSMCSRVSTPFSRSSEFVLWLWTAHNEVNKRLKNTEQSLKTGDPEFPKTIWPTKHLCSACYKNLNQNEESGTIDWDRDEVFKFLSSYYGDMLVSQPSKDKNKEQILIKTKTLVSEQVVLQSRANALAVPMLVSQPSKDNNKEQILIKTNAVVSEQVVLQSSANALAVPVGAALVGSCLLACFWRSRQKNQKYFHKPQLSKIV